MKIRQRIALAMIALLSIALVGACGKKSSTPTEAMKNFYEAVKKKDAAAVKAMLSKESLKMLEEDAKKKNKSVDDELQLDQMGSMFGDKVPEMRNEKIEGDKGSVEFKVEKSERWETATFVKEDGDWKASFK
jgi:uncharacterized membrane protein YvbJ